MYLSQICIFIHYRSDLYLYLLQVHICIFIHLPVPGLDPGDRQVLEHKYIGCDPPCLLDSSDGR